MKPVNKALLRLWRRVTPWRFRRKVLRFRANIWRRMLFKTTFIAITGSIGKTTTKECVAGVLSKRYRTGKTRYNRNCSRGVPRTLLTIKRKHRFAVIEMATGGPGQLARSAAIVRPKIAIVLTVARTHTDRFKTLEDTAAEKASLLDFLPPDGTAILNAEDPRVLAMASRCRCDVKTFGRSPSADIWAEEISSRWPARLSFRARTADESVWVQTQLVGEHWVNSVLAALLVGKCCGVPLEKGAAGLAEVQPHLARMQPVTLPCGATILRDEETASIDTVDAAMKVLGDAVAQRRILVMSDISDTDERTRVRVRRMGSLAPPICDMAVFVGEHAHYAIKGAIAGGMDAKRVIGFDTAKEGAEYLKSELREGDFMLIKGRTCDHLERIVHFQTSPVACWIKKCRQRVLCDLCPELRP